MSETQSSQGTSQQPRIPRYSHYLVKSRERERERETKTAFLVDIPEYCVCFGLSLMVFPMVVRIRVFQGHLAFLEPVSSPLSLPLSQHLNKAHAPDAQHAPHYSNHPHANHARPCVFRVGGSGF